MPKTPSDSSRPSAERQRPKASRKAAKSAAAPEAAAGEEDNFIQLTAEGTGRPPPNTIRLGSKGEKSGREKEDKTRKAARGKGERGASENRPLERAPRVPDSVSERFIQIGNKFHFPDGSEAFTHEGNRLTTRSENAIVIQSMVAIAREQGKGPVTVGGTDFFKKEAWFSASLAGLEVNGYKPTDFERERLARALAARRNPAAPESAPASDDRPAPKGEGAERGAARRPASDLIVGRLVDHGAAHYGHDPKQPMSYFVRVETDRGDRQIWGVDLERAFRQSLSTPGIGDMIGLRAIGQQAVTVLAAQRDAEGRQVGTAPLDARRNQWIVETKSFLDERRQMAEVLRDPDMNAAEAIRRHPELEGSYLQLQMGKELAKQQYRDKVQRQQFVDTLRAHIAQRIENGQPLEPVRLRGEERTVAPRSPDRDYHPTR